jgi:hypothetical protein
MKRRPGWVGGGLFLFALTLSCLLSIPAPAPAPCCPAKWVMAATAASSQPLATTPSESATSKEACLECHGPFEELARSTADYVAPSGEKGTPHRFVPHQRKDPAAIPGCSNCHEMHPVPPVPAVAGRKAGVAWCYGACHHDNNFTPCRICHP